tara:strand:+ start:165 stop:371 length:207 start_codon:yes stop_codon:yes gene_type:complete
MEKTKNKAQIFRAVLEEAKELLNKSIYNSVFSGGNPHKHKPEIKESRKLSFDALNKIDRLLEEVKNEK